MEFGYRIFDSSLIKQIDLSLIQISVWRTSEADIQLVKMLTDYIESAGKRHVIHPMDVHLSDIHSHIRQGNLEMVKRFAQMADLGLIIHDEPMPDGQPLKGEWRKCFRRGLAELEKICPISIENALDCRHAPWFWKTFAQRITFDIGHFESAGMDSLEVINKLNQELIDKIDFVHLHRSNGPKANGLIDHWPLVPGCPELKTLQRLRQLKPDLKVILELDTAEDIRESQEVLQAASF